MCKKFLLYIILVLTASTALAQHHAGQYIDNVIARIQESDGIAADFTLRGSDHSGLYLQGTIEIQGEKFHLSTNDMTTWYDGKTLWAYHKSIGEVNITEPTWQELVEINPYLLLDNYKQSFTVQEVTSTHRGERCFTLTPIKRNTRIAQVMITIATDSMSPISFVITDDNNNSTIIAITRYNDQAQLSDATFTFDRRQYPQATIVDLR